MEDTKKKALMGIKGMLEERMVARMKPAKEEKSVPDTDGDPMMDEHSGGLEEKVESEGGDLSKLSPEEQQELQRLYDKMGC